MRSFVDRPKYTCALGGAIATLNALPRVVPILHSGPGCGLNLSFAINGGAGYFGSGYCGGLALPSTNLCEKDIVFGGEDKLRSEIKNTLDIIDADLYVVVSGCTVEMIGDSIHAVTSDFQDEAIPIIAAETAGFKGNSYVGYDIIMETLFRKYVIKSNQKDERTVNVFGVLPIQDAYYKGNLRNIKNLLHKLGLKVNTFFGEDESLDNLKYSSNAALNIVFSDVYGILPAQAFEERFGTPYITLPLPIGSGASDLLIDEVTAALNLNKALAETIKLSEKEKYFGYLVRLADLYNDFDMQRYAVVIGDANYALPLTRYLADDLGWLPEVTILIDLLDDQEQKDLITSRASLIKNKGNLEIIFEQNLSENMKHIRRHWYPDNKPKYYNKMTPAAIIGSTFELDLATDLNVPLIPVTYPITNKVILSRGYTGYEGGLTLAEDIFSALVSTR